MSLNARLAVGFLIAALVLLGLGLLAPRHLAMFDRAVHRLGAAAAEMVGTIISLAIWLLALVPLWLINQIVRFRPLSSGWAGASSAWTPSGIRLNSEFQPDGYRRPSALDPPTSPLARRRTNLRRAAVLIAVALGLTAWQTQSGTLRSDMSASSTEGPPKSSGAAPATRPLDDPVPFDAGQTGSITWDGADIGFAFGGKDWARELFHELNSARQHLDPVLGARNGEVRGTYLNIRDGIRDTWTPHGPELTVWYFGGSTMYGIGQRDDHTIPSVVAKLAARDGIKIRSFNFGVSADVNWVETIRLAEALASDRKNPDLIVFYGGANEFGLGWERVDGGDRDINHSSRLSLSDAERTARAEQLMLQPKLDPAARANLAAELSAAQYRRGVLTARALAKSRAIPVVHFWQPQPFKRQAEDADPELYERLGLDVGSLSYSSMLYDRIRTDSEVDPIDLSRVFDGTRSRIYMDGSHTNELGASIVGKAMYERLKPELQDL
ncbi:MAG: hypothetical protein WBF71_02490 [Microthrixaceae bacterium]